MNSGTMETDEGPYKMTPARYQFSEGERPELHDNGVPGNVPASYNSNGVAEMLDVIKILDEAGILLA
jgi:hypothetical protein